MHFSSLPHIEHDLVLLRPMTAADIEPWFDYLSLPLVYEHTSWNVSRPDELAPHVWHSHEFTASSPLRFAIALRSSNALVGTAGFHSISPENATAEIAYDRAPSCWGKGVATAVCANLVAWAHDDAAMARVQATVLESNTRSEAVLNRCGFRKEGLLHAYRRVRGRHANFYMHAHVSYDAAA